MNTPDLELRRLTDAWHDGTITPEDGVRLERRLATDPAARRHVFDIAEIEATMAEAMASLPATATAKPQAWPRRLPLRAMAALFLLGLFCGALVIKTLPTSPPPATALEPAAAVVTGMLGVSWNETSSKQAITLPVGSAESRISGGLIELTFASGTRALIEGPAAFQVTGNNAIRLTHGKLVADVPKGAEGFSVTYPDGRIVDLGTEFGVEIASNGRSANFGVFRGEIEFHPAHDASQAIHLPENHAILFENGSSVSIPFDQGKFTRKLPSREFAWEIKGAATEPAVLEYDVSHLIWKPGRYRAICKWMTGRHGLITEGAELLLDGNPVTHDRHTGFSGELAKTQHNSYDFDISPDIYRRGSWTLRIVTRVDRDPGHDADATGVVLFEEGLAFHAEAADFIGTWEYLHDGKVFRRSFREDGGASLTVDGVPYAPFESSRWQVVGGSLVLDVAIAGGNRWREHHLLRDRDTLVFVDRPYRNATRVTD